MDTTKVNDYIESLRNLKENEPVEYLQKLRELQQNLQEYANKVSVLLEQIKK